MNLIKCLMVCTLVLRVNRNDLTSHHYERTLIKTICFYGIKFYSQIIEILSGSKVATNYNFWVFVLFLLIFQGWKINLISHKKQFRWVANNSHELNICEIPQLEFLSLKRALIKLKSIEHVGGDRTLIFSALLILETQININNNNNKASCKELHSL